MRSSEIQKSLKEIIKDDSELRQDLLWNHIILEEQYDKSESEKIVTELGQEIGMNNISWMELSKYILERYILYSPTISSHKKLQQVLFASIYLQNECKLLLTNWEKPKKSLSRRTILWYWMKPVIPILYQREMN